MFSLTLSWREFNVSLAAVDAWIRANAASGYAGISADDSLNLWFDPEIDEATQQYIRDYWNDLTEESEEVTAYVSKADIKAAVDAAREDAVTKDWDDLSVAQRKLLAGLTPTREELGV